MAVCSARVHQRLCGAALDTHVTSGRRSLLSPDGSNLSDNVSPAGALFSGVTQAVKEHTITAEYKFADGFPGRAEYRRDFSNQPFFLTEQPGILKKEQNTATLGLVWCGGLVASKAVGNGRGESVDEE